MINDIFIHFICTDTHKTKKPEFLFQSNAEDFYKSNLDVNKFHWGIKIKIKNGNI